MIVYVVHDYRWGFLDSDGHWVVMYAGTDYDAAAKSLSNCESKDAYMDHWQDGEVVKEENKQRGAK